MTSMSRVIFIVFLLVFVVTTCNSFLLSLGYSLSLRCTYADSYLKDALKAYDEMISQSLVSFYYHHEQDEPLKITSVNHTYHIRNFDATKPTRVVIHGFLKSHKSNINKAIKNAYMQNYDVNLIIVNYSKISVDTCYKIVRKRLNILGKEIAKFLDSVLSDDEQLWKNLVIVGHSLGAHTAGVVGRSVTKGRVPVILGLDPAGPGFKNETLENRLNINDADYVECIHTNGDRLGLKRPFCTVDIYPNFGTNQPGCKLLKKHICSHSRAWQYFAESLIRYFTADKCESIQNIYAKTPCNESEQIYLGGNDFGPKMNATGIFYLSTNDKSPFTKG